MPSILHVLHCFCSPLLYTFLIEKLEAAPCIHKVITIACVNFGKCLPRPFLVTKDATLCVRRHQEGCHLLQKKTKKFMQK